MGTEFATSRPSTHALAIVSLILSILGIAGVLPLVGAIGGIITGTIARKEIRANPEQHSGEGVAQAGIILGWVGIVLGIALCILIFVGILLFLVPLSWTIGPIETIPFPMPVP
jgi:hypothetical protein